MPFLHPPRCIDGPNSIHCMYITHAGALGNSATSRKTRYPLYRTLGGPQDRSGQVRKISSPLVFDPRTGQPVAQSLYRLSYRTHCSDSTATVTNCNIVIVMPVRTDSSRLLTCNTLSSDVSDTPVCLLGLCSRTSCL